MRPRQRSRATLWWGQYGMLVLSKYPIDTYISGPRESFCLYDDKGRRGGLRPESRFVIAGDLNAGPSRGLQPLGNGVFWSTSDDPLYRLVGGGTNVPTSDHRLVWQDVRVV